MCEQLNAWIGGFESILKRMTPANFDWLLHVMLVYHTQFVLKKQQKRQNAQNAQNNIPNNEESDNEELGI